MRVFDHEFPDYAVWAVCSGAVVFGVLMSFLLWWLCCRHNNKLKGGKKKKLTRIGGVKKKGKPDIAIDSSLVEQGQGRHLATIMETPAHLTPVPPPLSPARMRQVPAEPNVSISDSDIVPVQPKNVLSSTTSSISDVPESESRKRVLEERFEEGKIAKIKITVYHDDTTKELVITVIEIKAIHPSINYQSAEVELRRENGKSADKLTPVKLIPKSNKFKGGDKKYRFPMSVADISKYKFNFYLWSTNNYSRLYQAGNCLFKFDPEDFAGGSGFSTRGDFMKCQEEDTTDCTEVSVTLRYINRHGKLEVGIPSIANLQKTGWRKFASPIAENFHLPAKPMVKMTLSDIEGKVRETQRTEPMSRSDLGYSQDKKFTFEVPLRDLKYHVKLTLEISHSNLRVAHSKVGELEFCWENTGSEGEHWRGMIQMISSCGQPVQKTHFIKNLHTRK